MRARKPIVLSIVIAAAVAPAAAQASVAPASSRVAQSPASSVASATNLSPPPEVAGCYASSGDSWRRIDCDTAIYISQHIPRPEVLSGIGDTITKTAGAPFTLGVISADSTVGGSDTDTINGPGAYSVQDNVNFTGSNGANDGVQFTDQTLGNGLHNACVWQIDINTQSYHSACGTFPSQQPVPDEYVEGWVQDGLLTTAVIEQGGGGLVVVAPDLYRLGSDNRWTNNSGSVLGEGTPPHAPAGAEAVFTTPTQEDITDQVASCLNNDGFIDFSAIPCNAKPIKPLAFTGYSPGPITDGDFTVETNNLIPVIGGPPAHLPAIEYPGPHTAQISYVATTTGTCVIGTPPLCK